MQISHRLRYGDEAGGQGGHHPRRQGKSHIRRRIFTKSLVLHGGLESKELTISHRPSRRAKASSPQTNPATETRTSSPTRTSLTCTGPRTRITRWGLASGRIGASLSRSRAQNSRRFLVSLYFSYRHSYPTGSYGRTCYLSVVHISKLSRLRLIPHLHPSDSSSYTELIRLITATLFQKLPSLRIAVPIPDIEYTPLHKDVGVVKLPVAW